MDHVLIRKLEHLTGNQSRPELGYAIEMRDRPGPADKMGAFENDVVWVQLHGGLIVAKARVEICWRGEFSSPKEIRMRVRERSDPRGFGLLDEATSLWVFGSCRAKARDLD